MKINVRFAAVFAAVLALASPALADPYKVRDLLVDATGPTAAQAQQQARVQSRLMGAQRLIDRLTLPEDRAQAREPIDVNFIATRMAQSEQIQEQLKSAPAPGGGIRTTGVTSWTFIAKDVREYLDARGVPFVDTQAAKALLVPVSGQGVDPAAWGAQWTQTVVTAGEARLVGRSDDTVLTPYVASIESWSRRPSWTDVQQEITDQRADHAILAEAYSQGGQYYVRLIDLRTGVAEANIGVAGPFGDLASAKAGAIAELERAWKVRSVVRTSGSDSVSLVAMFRDIGEWVKIRKGLETSRLVRNLSIESISAAGADLSFVYSGRPDQLVTDLRSRGVDLRSGENGWVLQVVSAQ